MDMTAEDLFYERYSEVLVDMMLDNKEKRHDYLKITMCAMARDFSRIKCREQREICAENAKAIPVVDAEGEEWNPIYPDVDKDSILSAPEPEM